MTDKFQQVTAKEYNLEQENPFSFGASALKSLIILNPSGGIPSLNKTSLVMKKVKALIDKGDYSYTDFPTLQPPTKKKVLTPNQKMVIVKALDFGTFVHDFFLNDRTIEQYNFDSELLSDGLYKEVINTMTYGIIHKEPMYWIDYETKLFHEKYPNLRERYTNFGTGEESYLYKTVRTLEGKDINTSIRCEADLFTRKGDVLYIGDLKTAKDLHAFTRSKDSYFKQMMLYAFMLIYIKGYEGIKFVHTDLILFDKSLSSNNYSYYQDAFVSKIDFNRDIFEYFMEEILTLQNILIFKHQGHL